MVNRHNRLLVAFHVLSDSMLGMTAFILSYLLRFETGLIPVPKGTPPLGQYVVNILPFIAALVPLGFQLQGLYRLRRGRSRVDDFFAVFVGSILAVIFVIVGTLYVQTYFATPGARARGAFEVSQWVWAIFLVLNVALTYASRELVRDLLERRWRAGIGLKRILIAGSGELGRLVADKILEHRELGYQIVGFVDDRATGDHLGYRGLPLLGTIEEAADISSRESVDHLYVALPPEQHVQMLQLIESTSREFVDVKVVPDLLQVVGGRAGRGLQQVGLGLLQFLVGQHPLLVELVQLQQLVGDRHGLPAPAGFCEVFRSRRPGLQANSTVGRNCGGTRALVASSKA